MRRLANRGDTIVEVLIATAVVSAVLGGAYASANRSLTASRQAQERVEALKMAEGQMERLKSLGKDGTNPVYTVSPLFCIDNNNNVKSPSTDPLCTDSSLGVSYSRSIDRATSVSCPSPPGCLFTVKINWDRAGGGGTDEVKMVYKLYPG